MTREGEVDKKLGPPEEETVAKKKQRSKEAVSQQPTAVSQESRMESRERE